MATDHNFKVKNGLTVQGETLVVNHTGDVSGTQVYIKKKDSSTNLMRWGEGTSGVTTYKWRMDQFYEFIGNNGSDVIILKSSDGSIQGQSYKIGSTTIIDSSRNLSNIGTISSGAITSSGNSVFTGGNSDGTGNAFEIKRGGNSQQQAIRVQNTGEVVVSNNYLYAAHTGTSFYSQGDAVFRATIRNDTSGMPVKVSDDFNVTGDIQSNGTVILQASGRNLTNIGTISSGAITSGGIFKNGSYTRILTGASNTGQLTFNARWDGSGYVPDYAGVAAAGMTVFKMAAGGYGGVEVYVKNHGTTSSSQALSTFTKVADFNDGGYFDASNGLRVGGSAFVDTSRNITAGAITSTSSVYATEFDLPSSGSLDWANGDARIVEGLVNNYSLSFQTYDGSSLTTALRLDGDNSATFAGTISSGAITSSGDVKLNGSAKKYAAPVYRDVVTGISNSGYTTLFTVDGGGLASTIKMTLGGTTGSVVVNVTADITAGHYQDILITSKSGFYTTVTLKVISNNNEDFAVQAKTNSANSVSLTCEVFPLNNELVTFTTSHSFTGSSLEHTCHYGTHTSGTGGNDGDLTVNGRTFVQDGSIAAPALTFRNDHNTGLYRVGSDSLGWVVGGSRKFYTSASRAYFQNLTEGVDVPSLRISGTEIITTASNLTNIGTIDSADIHIESGTGGTNTQGLLFTLTDNADAQAYIKKTAYYMHYNAHYNEGHRFTVNGTDDLLRMHGSNNGTRPDSIDILAGNGLYMNNTRIMDISRNLQNIAGLHIAGGGTYSDPGSQMYLHADGSGYGRLAVYDMRFMTGNNSARTVQALHLGSTGAATFASTISSGPITVTSGGASMNGLVIGNNTQSQYSNIILYSNSGNAQIWKNGGSGTTWGGTSSLNIYNSNGTITLHPQGTDTVVKVDSSGLHLANSADYISLPAYSDYLKLRLHGTDSNYAIGMASGQTYGGLNDWAMTFMFNDESDRGFKWMDAAHGVSQGAMALTTDGRLTVANALRVGYGEGDTTTPGAAYDLDVSGHGQVTGRFYALDGLLKTNRRITTAQTVPIGHYSEGDQVFALDTSWTDSELQSYFNSSNVSWSAQSDAPGGYAVYINGNVNVGGVYNSGFPYIPVDQDDEFYMECWIKNAGTGQTHYMGSNEFNQSFSNLGGHPGSFGYWVMSNTNPGSSWTKVSAYITGFSASTVGTFENGTKYWTPQALFNYGAGTGTRACYISGWKVIRVKHQGNRTFAGNVTLGVGGSTGVLGLRTYDDASNRWDLYTWTDDTFRVNYNGSGGDEMVMDSSGNVVFAGNVTAYSDEKLKENIKTLDGSKVLEMRGVSFTKDGQAGSGVIAQELEKVAPELVSEVGDFKAVSYGNLTGYLIEAVKLQQQKIEKLEELVEKLISEK